MEKTPLDSWIAQKIGANGGSSGLSGDELEKYQFSKLKDTISYVRINSAFYRRTLENYDIGSLDSLNDLSQFPFTRQEDIAENGPQFVCVSQGKIERIVSLNYAGASMITKRLYFTSQDLDLTIDFFHQGMSTFTRPGQRVFVMVPGDRPYSVGDLLATALGRLDAEGIVYGFVQDPADAIREIVRLEIDVLVGTPVNVLSLVRHSDHALMLAPRIKSVLLSSDYVSPAIVREIENVWGCKVYSHYGSTEMGYGGGVECEAVSGYHLREADLLFEVVDPDSNEPKKPGDVGEVVFSTLTREGMPLIRYRTGDLSRFVDGPCACGSALRRLDRIRGRLSEFVRIGSDEWLGIPDLDDVLFAIPELLDYEVTLKGEQDANELDIVLETNAIDTKGVVERARNSIIQLDALRKAFNDRLIRIGTISFGEVAKIRSSAQKRAIIDRRTGRAYN